MGYKNINSKLVSQEYLGPDWHTWIDTLTIKLLVQGFLSGFSFQSQPENFKVAAATSSLNIGHELDADEKRVLAEKLRCYTKANRIILYVNSQLRLFIELDRIDHVITNDGRVCLQDTSALRLGVLTFNIALALLCMASQRRSNSIHVKLGELRRILGYHPVEKFIYAEIKRALQCLCLVHFSGTALNAVKRDFTGKSTSFLSGIVRVKGGYSVSLSQAFGVSDESGVRTNLPLSSQNSLYAARSHMHLNVSSIGMSRHWTRSTVALAIFLQTESGNKKLKIEDGRTVAYRMSRFISEAQIRSRRSDRAMTLLMRTFEELKELGMISTVRFTTDGRDPVIHVAIKGRRQEKVRFEVHKSKVRDPKSTVWRPKSAVWRPKEVQNSC